MSTYFPALRIKNPDHRAFYRRTQVVGLIPIVFSVMLMFSVKPSPGPGLWAVFGLALGLQMILWGVVTMHKPGEPLSERGRRLVEKSDEWLPNVLFFTQQAFLILLLTMLWLCLCQVGYPCSLPLHIIVILLIAPMPLNGWAHARAMTLRTGRSEILQSFFRYTNGILVTLFLALTLTELAKTEDATFASHVPARLIFIWVPSILIIITCVVSFAAHTRPLWKHREGDDSSDY